MVTGISHRLEGLCAGNLYFALVGTQYDGHTGVEAALKLGALPIVEKEECWERYPGCVLVDSTRRAWGESLSVWHAKPSEKLRLVGITGTNGKTTCSFLLEQVWRRLGERTGLIGTVEYRVGEKAYPAPLTTPDALVLQPLFEKMVEASVGFAVMEVSSIALDQRRTAGCVFETVVFTNFTPDHLDYHKSMERYWAAKRLLVEEYRPKTIVLNADDPTLRAFSQQLGERKRLHFSLHDRSAEFSVSQVDYRPEGMECTLHTPAGQFRLRSVLMGEHNLSNCLAVLATLHAMGFELSRVLPALETAVGAPGRLERVAMKEGRPHVFVDYAHTEDALRNVLLCLRGVRGEKPIRVWTVFGCGGDRDKLKRPEMAKVASELSDFVVVTSDNPRTEDPDRIIDEVIRGIQPGVACHREVDRRAAIEWALERASAGDFVLVAGKGHEDYQILGTVKVPFDDRKVVRDFFERKD
jgi:UDP-N-acetylmuramoyl-L-alanyl-D-glutamate--2,6-diaminopimelate ligase